MAGAGRVSPLATVLYVSAIVLAIYAAPVALAVLVIALAAAADLLGRSGTLPTATDDDERHPVRVTGASPSRADLT